MDSVLVSKHLFIDFAQRKGIFTLVASAALTLTYLKNYSNKSAVLIPTKIIAFELS